MQDKTDIIMQKELDKVVEILKNKTYSDYCQFEDEVGGLLKKHCPTCQEEIKKIRIGIFPFMSNIRNYIRFNAGISFTSSN